MNTKDEEYILALDHFRSITKAAAELHVTQPTLSIFLSNMETRIGTPLFFRVGKKLMPTPAGKAYIRYSHQIVALKNDFENEILEYVRGTRGELHIGCTYRGSHSLMPKVIGIFSKKYPEIEIILHDKPTESLKKMMIEGQLDAIYVNFSIDNDYFHKEAMQQDHLLLVLSHDHPAVSSGIKLEGSPFPYLDLNFIANEKFFLMEKGRAIRTQCDAAMDFAGCEPKTIRDIDHIEIGFQMAAEGLGAAFTMESYVKESNHTQGAALFRVGDPNIYTTWFLICRKNIINHEYMQDFRQILREYSKKTK